MPPMRKGRLFATTLVCAAACAAAGTNGGAGSGDDQPVIDAATAIDARPPGDAAVGGDAPSADAAPVAVTLSQTTGATIGSNNSVACGNPDGTTAENSWYRVWKLADEGVVGGFHVTAVTFGVQEAIGSPIVQVKIGTYAGTLTPPPALLDTGLVTPITATTFNVPTTLNTATTTVTVPISANVPALSQLIVEVFSPNFSGTSKYFYLGGNSLGETRPGYLRAPGGACATPQPKTTTALGFPMSNLVITVSGTK